MTVAPVPLLWPQPVHRVLVVELVVELLVLLTELTWTDYMVKMHLKLRQKWSKWVTN